jgi:hypothetical protein
MVSTKQLLIEAAVIGIIFVILLAAVEGTIGGLIGGTLSVFLAAALFHVAAEYTGWNKKFCDEYR